MERLYPDTPHPHGPPDSTEYRLAVLELDWESLRVTAVFRDEHGSKVILNLSGDVDTSIFLASPPLQALLVRRAFVEAQAKGVLPDGTIREEV